MIVSNFADSYSAENGGNLDGLSLNVEDILDPLLLAAVSVVSC